VDVVDLDLPQDLVRLHGAREAAQCLVEQAPVLVENPEELREGRTARFPAIVEHGIPNVFERSNFPIRQG